MKNYRVVHFEIPSENPEESMAFFKEVFGWEFRQFGDQPYWFVRTGDEKASGINGGLMQRKHPQQPVVNNILVANIDETLADIEKAGGMVVVPKTAVNGMGWSAYFMDPDKNIHGVWQMDENAK